MKSCLVLLSLLLTAAAASVQAAAGGSKLRGPVFGCRVPRKYFVVKGAPLSERYKRRPRLRCGSKALFDVAGFGETDAGSGQDPYETGVRLLGSLHLWTAAPVPGGHMPA